MLIFLLRLSGTFTSLAFLAMLLPVDWMDSIHRSMGLGELPRAPVVDYLARSVAALYGFHGALLLLMQVTSALAQQTLGQIGVYVISLVGGLFSSASAVAAAATLVTSGTITPPMAGICTIIASLASVVVNVPLVLVAHARPLMQRLAWAVGLLLVVGAVGVLVQLAGGTVAQRLVQAWGHP